MYIGLISDTHGVFDERVRKFLEPVDELWHAGDWAGDDDFIKSITGFKPVVGVYGNCDGQDARLLFPSFQFFQRGGMSILMTHIGGYPGKYDMRAQALIENYRPQIFVCGHSHILKVVNDSHYDMLCINPGACGIQGWHLVRTALRFRIDQGKVDDMEVFELERDNLKNF
ncbi:MAG: metallophosphatase family protein [Bacteroidales bacterium]|nr:metallophosphatase family protein [Bacteroidales bacterium]